MTVQADFTSQEYFRNPAAKIESRANLAVEEFLRFVSPEQFTKPRFVRKDAQFGRPASSTARSTIRLKASDFAISSWSTCTAER